MFLTILKHLEQEGISCRNIVSKDNGATFTVRYKTKKRRGEKFTALLSYILQGGLSDLTNYSFTVITNKINPLSNTLITADSMVGFISTDVLKYELENRE